MPEHVISVSGLRKSYGDFEAVRGIDLEVERGEVFAFLGPNGAGKTTTVEILEGFRERSAGEVSVLGSDPAEPDKAWRERVGFVLQQSQPERYLTVSEVLSLYAGYYTSPRRVDEVIELVGLQAKADERNIRLSGGQKRRLDVALALIGDPELIFLDEPTTGFDPEARRQAWEVVESLKQLGKTVFLTTHYMEEAQRLADRVTIISRGEIVASATPENLGDRDQRPATVTFKVPAGTSGSGLPDEVAAAVGAGSGEVSIPAHEPVVLLNHLTGWALENGIELDGLEVKRPSLEDVYLELTGGDAEGEDG